MSNDDGTGDLEGRASPFAPEDEYFLEIESRFAELRQTPFVFSARDWSLMKSWRDEGIPLSVVLEAVESCFEARARSPRPRTISSLSYCRHAVKELWNERRSLHVGGTSDAPETNAASQLSDLEASLRSLAESMESERIENAVLAAAKSVSAVPRGESIPRIEARLLEIEDSLMKDLEDALPETRRKTLESEIDDELSRHRFRDDEIRARTRLANLRRALRKELSLPRLSLFG